MTPDNGSPLRAPRGVYFLANDWAYDQTVAFLNSFRLYNPTIPLCLVPFDADTQRLRTLADEYNFFVFEDPRTLAVADAVNVTFFTQNGVFRKLTMWNGPFEEFVYFDTDMIVLHSVDFMYDLLREYDFVFGASDYPTERHWTWLDSIESSGMLKPEQYNFAANAGLIASRRNALKFDELFQRALDALPLRKFMESSWDQPFINYLAVTSGKYTSLHTLVRAGRPLPIEAHVHDKRWIFKAGSPPICDGEEKPVLALHWAGTTHPRYNAWYVRMAVKPLQKLAAALLQLSRPARPRDQFWQHFSKLRKSK